ncbi:integrin beta-nu [Chelonus insularis]|uniref:integrin beta-nu n=1 Tax=Chelonus insularis TaxID=460826 RepID=UPI00158AA263|nr:integrin beta-nu [Chelonus insularis]
MEIITTVFMLILLNSVHIISPVVFSDDSLYLCAIQTSCKSCLEKSSVCAWCSEWSYANSTVGKLRCSSADRLEKFGCPKHSIHRASMGSIKLLQDDEFQDVVISDQVPIQLKPQRVRVKLRPHSNETIYLKYRPAKNYPLDLYYLMDLTWSMNDDKDTLVSLGWKIAHTLGTFTSNFRLGFGSYADKPLMPYVFPGHENNPCSSQNTVCAPLYSFKNHMQLSEDVLQFIQQVNSSRVTGNVDNLEGGLDGVVQAIVCKDQVGWARQARKLMLVATDGLMHFAGEGKLGGVVNRHDFLCHLDKSGEYYMSKAFDYPSLAELSRLLKQRKVNLIFAVTEDRRSEYEQIAYLLQEKARVATLAANSSNILEIIEKSYHDILTKVVLRDNSTDLINIKYYSKCGDNKNPEKMTSTCEGIQEGEVYTFRIVLSLDDCPRNESLWRQKIVIDDALASEVSESMIEVELQCGCDCEKKSPHCNNGIDECGICRCNHGWSGETCDCDESNWTENRLLCIKPDDTEVCSNRGECICGNCNCDPGANGKYCECSPCDKTDGVECGGRGTCDCGICLCLDGWEGDACECPTGNELCIAPGSSEVCANHGYCECGQCRCNITAPSDGLLYRGTFCESSASAGGSSLCVLYEDCVNATVEESNDIVEYCHLNKSNEYKIQRVDEVDASSDHYCFVRTVIDTTICTIPFVYKFTEDNKVLLKIANKICQTPLPAAVLPMVAFLAVFLIGIGALMIWKCWTAIKDARECAKFEEEQKKTIYALMQNPIYRPPISVFKVPNAFKED